MSVVSPPAVLASEWTKVRSVRSTIWTLLSTFLVSLVLSAAFSWFLRTNFNELDSSDRERFDAAAFGFFGLQFGQIMIVIFGVLVVSTEYTTGMIRSSLAAVPQRGVLLAAKIGVGGLLALAVSAVTVFVTFFTAQSMIGSAHNVSISDPGVTRAVLGAVAYMTLICVFSMGVAAMLRSSVLSLGILIPLFFIVSPILASIPKVKTVGRYLPDQAGTRVMEANPPPDAPVSPLTGLIILLLWTAASVFGGYLVIKSRDA
jgi:ABC-type transport system involved in multi-copper enzyme maturation permease subunit